MSGGSRGVPHDHEVTGGRRRARRADTVHVQRTIDKRNGLLAGPGLARGRRRSACSSSGPRFLCRWAAQLNRPSFEEEPELPASGRRARFRSSTRSDHAKFVIDPDRPRDLGRSSRSRRSRRRPMCASTSADPEVAPVAARGGRARDHRAWRPAGADHRALIFDRIFAVRSNATVARSELGTSMEPVIAFSGSRARGGSRLDGKCAAPVKFVPISVMNVHGRGRGRRR